MNQPEPLVPQDVKDGIMDRLWPYVGLVAAGHDPSGAKLPEHLAACTFVRTGGASYVLTADHVWKRILRDRLDLFLVLKRGDATPLHVYRDAIVASRHSPTGDAVDGPDLVFLRLPDLLARQVGSDKGFYDLDRPRGLPSSPYWIFIGAPWIYDDESQPGRLGMTVKLIASSKCRRLPGSGGYDYVEVDLDPDSPAEIPPDFRAVSGAGLWLVSVDFSEVADPVDALRLSGVIYFQQRDGATGRIRSLRCHGEQSLYDHRP
jgi:hypothetical protein